ncbi:DUF1980 domain-containing protein [Heliobacterium chlorum]|uniref:DUF1980 domain-containing protein n=1 Tax=Heliobacterium chlorum TaxID=2698 RepID=A0ABR7T3X5_HELCL|nr:DUF1980 domain-containing protein [Heliobacterium chlorum]MBC9785465.1 DUF1980 domain-containing protein [Heliobacterium chlorum]
MNLQRLKFFILLALAVWAATLSLTGTVNYYIHPRYGSTITIAAGVLTILAAAQWLRLRREGFHSLHSQKGLAWGNLVRCGLIALPLLFSLLPGSPVLSGEFVTQRGVRLPEGEEKKESSFLSEVPQYFHDHDRSWVRSGLPKDVQVTEEGPEERPEAKPVPGAQGEGTAETAPEKIPETSPEAPPKSTENSPPEGTDSPKPSEQLPEEKIPPTPEEPPLAPKEKSPVLFDEKNFLQLLLDINGKPDDFEGRPIEISGYLVQSPGGNQGLYVGRYVVNCCVADTVIMGMAVDNLQQWMQEHTPEKDRIKIGSWVKAKGVMEKAKEPGTPGGLVIWVNEINMEAPPRNPYIYVN